MTDPYQILGVERDASQDEIRSAYRKLAKKHHPDLNPGNAKAEKTFKTVSVANELLSDPERRARFDRASSIKVAKSGRSSHLIAIMPKARQAVATAVPGSPPRAGTPMISARCSARCSTNSAALRSRRPDAAVTSTTLKTEFLDAITGATRRLTLPDGRTLDVKIPPGTLGGQTLRLRGQGSQGHNGGPVGDALIEIQVAPHRYFKRDGHDIRLDLPITENASGRTIGHTLEDYADKHSLDLLVMGAYGHWPPTVQCPDIGKVI